MAEVLQNAPLPEAIFGIQPNVPVMHQVVTAQLAAARSGTHATKNRSEVSGGGSKPWRQKGTGRARQGSSRAPHWRGGGVAHGPQPRSYRQRTPKKMVWLALRSALSDRAAAGMVTVVDDWNFAAPRTKDAIAALDAIGVAADERVLVVLRRDDDVAWRSFRNLGDRVDIVLVEELNTYDVLVADRVIFTSATLEALSARGGGAS
ncbi:MAG TPA: 50S ribosomal protein L4 [Acidimicrobiia bacterium]|nr:50S ribosomal protein L4 [Acidimicrobiia bacterium]